jgi:hypothetical protein
VDVTEIIFAVALLRANAEIRGPTPSLPRFVQTLIMGFRSAYVIPTLNSHRIVTAPFVLCTTSQHIALSDSVYPHRQLAKVG